MIPRQKVLITGGVGYIGSHTVVEMLQEGYEVVVIDDFSNSQPLILERISQITARQVRFYELSLLDTQGLERVFEQEKHFDSVVHFAAFKAVGESVQKPLLYYQNNLCSLLNILSCMQRYACTHFIFSSSCTVYGTASILPITEDTPFQKALSAYGSTKQMGEDILEKMVLSTPLKVISLRYFNPVGAHPSALIGELPQNKPNNLVPFITQTAIGKQKELLVFGNDYPTPDGTCVRDYIHVVDLAKAHVKSCHRIHQAHTPSLEVFNIGTGTGTSVLELLHTFMEVNKVKVPYQIVGRRAGDVAEIYASAHKAKTLLDWQAQHGLQDMLRDAWRWETKINEVV